MPIVPFQFDPSYFSDPDFYFEETTDGDLRSALWKQMGLCIYFTNGALYWKEADVQKHTPGITFHQHFGFSLTQYHEFFVETLPAYMEMRLGKIEVSIGQPSPLAIRLFDNYHDKRAHGDDWGAVNTIRIYGTGVEHCEAYFLNSMRRYQERYLVLPTPIEITPVDWWEDPHEGEQEAPVRVFAPISRDIEPLRCFYYGEAEREAAAAFIQYYRVIEYYAFLALQQSVAVKRNDHALSDRAFMIEVASMLGRDEKGALVRLIQRISTPPLLQAAVATGLTRSADASSLASDMYDFRNSVVHAKYDQRASLVVDSVLRPSTRTARWRSLMRDLAAIAIDELGTKDLE